MNELFTAPLGISCAQQTFSDEAVINLVDTTVDAIEEDAVDTLRRINAREAPYMDAEIPGLYVYVLDTNVTVVANPDNIMTGGGQLQGNNRCYWQALPRRDRCGGAAEWQWMGGVCLYESC